MSFKPDFPMLTDGERKMLLRQVLECLPEKQQRKPDEDYMYCIKCNQIIDTLEADCFCSIHNLAIDQATANIKKMMGQG